MLLVSQFSLLGDHTNRFKLIRKNTLTKIWPSYWPIRIGIRSLKTASTECILSLARIKPPPVRDRSGISTEYIGALRRTFQFALKSPARANARNQYIRHAYADKRMHHERTNVRANLQADGHARHPLERAGMGLRIEFAARIINYGARNWIKEDGERENVVGDDIRNGNGRINFWRQMRDRNYIPRWSASGTFNPRAADLFPTATTATKSFIIINMHKSLEKNIFLRDYICVWYNIYN